MLRCSPLSHRMERRRHFYPPSTASLACNCLFRRWCLRAGHCQRGSAVVDFPQTEETDGRRAGGTSCIGDDVAMGGVSVGGSWWQGKSAVVHRVNPVEGEEWVLVIDWVAVQE